MEREEEESMLLVAENGEGEGKKEAEERKVEETKRIIGKRRYIVWLLLHTESDDSSQYPRLTSQLSLLSTLSQAGELTLQSLCKKKPGIDSATLYVDCKY
ncbi:unnamed protein product [Brassica napus]|uniref:(rape) hypothetical protein n=1 Tax=Brassica napus TaxID=3708 RepID=A0A816LCQ8_BRANA|nr:unnamed protein product [Brassica napus]